MQSVKKRIFPSLVMLMVVLFSGLAGCSRSKYVAKITKSSIKKPEDVKEVYYSNYFSFHGQDQQGRVVLAIDNNRWKRKDKFGADRFLAMYTNGKWITLKGKGGYKNKTHSLLSIPDGNGFTYKGSPQKGITINSEENHLKLTIAPLKRHSRSARGFARFNMSSAKATLHWKNREIKGRVIQEYLRAPNFSKKIKEFIKLGGGNFAGLYLNVDGKGSLYIHRNRDKDESFTFISGAKESFITYPLRHRWTHFEAHILDTHKHLFYSFPLKMKYTLSASNPAVHLKIHTVDLKTFSNLFFFGFAMGYVKGTLTVDSKTYPVFGFSELIAT